ncbi:MAG: hypothetical protein ACI361_06445 [Atopobiaceae bacterium]
MDWKHSTFEDMDAAIAPARWRRRPPERTSRLSKAVCMLAAGFALVALLGTGPVTPYAEEAAVPQDMQQAADGDAASASDAAAWAEQHADHATASEPPHMDGHGVPESTSEASISLAAAYVSEELDGQDEEAEDSGESGNADESAMKLKDAVISSVGESSPSVVVPEGGSLDTAHTAVVAVAADDTAALSVASNAEAYLRDGSAVSASGERSIGISVQGEGSLAVLNDASAYASGTGCAALEASDGGTISMQGGQLEADGGCIVRAEGSGSSVSISETKILSESGFAELVGETTLSLDGVTSTSSHAPAIYVAAGMPRVKLRNGSVISGSVIVAPGADIEMETDMTSRLDGSVVYLS